MGGRQCSGAWVLVPLRLCAWSGWCVAYSSPSLPYPFPSLAFGALLSCLLALPLAAALGCHVLHTWLVVACGSLCAYAPSYLRAAPLRFFVFGCFACVCVVWAYLSHPLRACGGGRILSATPLWLPSLARLSLCFSVVCGVAWHVTYLCRRTVALGGGMCGSLGAYILLSLRRHVCACARGIPFAPYVRGRAGLGLFSRPHLPRGHLCWRGYRCALLVCIVRRGAARNILVSGGRWCCGCLFVYGFCFCVCCTFLWLCEALSVRSSFHSLTVHAPSCQVAFPRRWWHRCACCDEHTFGSLCLGRVRVGSVSRVHLLVFLVGAVTVLLFLAM